VVVEVVTLLIQEDQEDQVVEEVELTVVLQEQVEQEIHHP
jgi:hypothetical protein